MAQAKSMSCVAAVFVFIGIATQPCSAQQLATQTPEQLGVRSEVLREMSQWVRDEQLDIRSMILLRQGDVALEWYAGGRTRDDNHNVFSITKSVVATLTGIAVRDGKIAGPKVTMAELFPEIAALEDDPQKAGMTVADLLTMRSGLPCARGNERSGPRKALFNRIHRADNRTQLILQLEMVREPGRVFTYGNAEPQLVAAILERAYDRKLHPLAEEVLFEPLGFKNHQWRFPDKSGAVTGGYGLWLRAIDLAKLGQLYLQQGTWNEKEIVPPQWIEQATCDQTGTGYGYFWWTGSGDGTAFSARGVRGQQIFVEPKQQLVFVVTANLPADEVRPTLRKLTGEYLRQAVSDQQLLPANPAGFARLEAEIQHAAAYFPKRQQTIKDRSD